MCSVVRVSHTSLCPLKFTIHCTNERDSDSSEFMATLRAVACYC